MIPKIIHYCWFGRNPLPQLAHKCLRSWKKFCPDYQIMVWNEETFDVDSAPKYVQDAYREKKWAFVTDYVRLYALIEHGGVYMDTDVELVKPVDPFMIHSAFSGFEDDTHVPTGIMAAEKGFPMFKKLLSYYDSASFINEDGSYNLTTNVETITKMLTDHGFIPNGQYQEVMGFALYPRDYFCPIEYESYQLNKTQNTVAIHWFAGSWKPEKDKMSRQERLKKEKIHRIIHTPNRWGRKVMGDKNYDKLKHLLKKENE